MKAKSILLAVLLAPAIIANAQLVDLTPGGFNPDDGLPPAYFQLIDQTFFDEAAHGTFCLPDGCLFLNGWVSMFGAIDGGTYFFTDLFDLGDTGTASIWWDFDHTINGLTMVDVWGRKPDGTAWEHIYGVRPSRFRRSHAVTVTLDGLTTIASIGFYGLDSRPRPGGNPRSATLIRNLLPMWVR